MTLDAKVPGGPIAAKWDRHKFEMKLVNPANKRKFDIIVVGSVPKGKSILRSGAKPGDRIYVTGDLGGSADAVARMHAQPRKKLNPRDYPRHFFPEPRVELGRILREKDLEPIFAKRNSS